jgi:hypothetical protein
MAKVLYEYFDKKCIFGSLWGSSDALSSSRGYFKNGR